MADVIEFQFLPSAADETVESHVSPCKLVIVPYVPAEDTATKKGVPERSLIFGVLYVIELQSEVSDMDEL